eukprot:5091248-Pleurochrysis_carterae.AAC.1
MFILPFALSLALLSGHRSCVAMVGPLVSVSTDLGAQLTCFQIKPARASARRGSGAGAQVWGSGKYEAKKADVWALGVTLHAMAFGTLPFFSMDQQKLIEQARRAHAPGARARARSNTRTHARDLIRIHMRARARAPARARARAPGRAALVESIPAVPHSRVARSYPSAGRAMRVVARAPSFSSLRRLPSRLSSCCLFMDQGLAPPTLLWVSASLAPNILLAFLSIHAHYPASQDDMPRGNTDAP